MMLSSIPCGDLELNVAHPHGTPTLVPSPGLEQQLDVHAEPTATAEHPPLPLVVHLHVYYLETLEPLLRQLLHCQVGLGPFNMWVSTDNSSKAAAIEASIRRSPLYPAIGRLQVRVCSNRGRNLGPLLLELWPELRSTDLLLHLHGKRSVESNLGTSWLEQLLQTLLPDAEGVLRLRQRFADEPQLGLVMPQPPELIRPYLNWGNNFELANLLVGRLDRQLSRDAVLVFPAGMMFWCRPAALEPLAQLCRGLGELPPEPLAVDGTSLHAFERLVAHGCEAAGLRWRLLCPTGAPPVEKPAVDLSLWQPCPESYQQATAYLAARARQETEQRLCSDQNLAQCTAQLVSADAQIRQLMQAVQERDQRLVALKGSLSWRLTAPFRVLLRTLRRQRRAPAET